MIIKITKMKDYQINRSLYQKKLIKRINFDLLRFTNSKKSIFKSLLFIHPNEYCFLLINSKRF